LSSDFILKLARAAGVVSLVAVGGLLSSCQVRPLYAENTGVTQKLAAVSFSDVGSRVGLEVRNHLVFIANHGGGEPKNPQYDVTLTVTSGTSGVIYLPSSSTSAAARTTVTVSYVLKRISDGKVLKAGNRAATSLLDQPTQEFGKIRADIDSENRAAAEAAELVAADLAATLSR
jgi:LPS-assembly lipoprotein